MVPFCLAMCRHNGTYNLHNLKATDAALGPLNYREISNAAEAMVWKVENES